MPTRASYPLRTTGNPSPGQTASTTRPMEESSVRQMMQKLESLEQESGHNGHVGHNRWMVPYADLLTLLLGLFLVLFTTQKPQAHPPQTQRSLPQPTIASHVENATPLPAHPNTQDQPSAPLSHDTSHDASLTRQLQRNLGKAIPMKGIEVHQQMRGVVISLKDNILFAPGSADLTPDAHQTLNHLVGQLHAALGGQSRPIRVEGHTDSSPIATSKYPSNWELSTARATTIVRYLVASRHFQPEMLSAAGYGEFKPLKDNSSIEGKQKNRRVDIVVLRPDLASDMSTDTAPHQPMTLGGPSVPGHDRAP